MIEIHIGFVEDDNLPGLHTRANLPRPLGIVVTGGVNEDEIGQKTLEVEPHVALGCGLAAAMFGPVHARSNQLDGRGIHNVDRLAEAVGHAPAPTPTGKARGQCLKVPKHSPEKLLSQNGLALLARMGEPVTTRRGRAANCRERATMKAQLITHVIESDRVGQLRVEHRDDMASRGKRPARFVHPRFSRQLRHELGRNEIAELAQNAELGCRWAGLFFHPLPSGRSKCPRPSNPQLFRLLCGTAVISITEIKRYTTMAATPA